jgi:diguanylate cyclase (GGDEF)-like protein
MILGLINFALVVVGIFFLLLSLRSARNILKEQDANRIGWLVLFALILLFITGYVFFAYTLLGKQATTLSEILSVMLFGGGLFVILVVNMSLGSLREMMNIARRERFRAMHDELTGLPNRSYLYEQMRKYLADASYKNEKLIVLLMDLDRFKDINDTLGHHYGDELLRRISPMLSSCVSESGIVARVGGDEFAIVLPRTNIQGAIRVINKIASSVEQNYQIDNHSLDVRLSIGLAVYPTDGESRDELMKKADVAMYMAKRTGATYVAYDKSIDEYSIRRLNMTAELREAVKHGQLQLYYQPKVEMFSQQICGMEALARWHHPKHGFLSPVEFISVAEQNGMINSLSRWVLHTALHEFKTLSLQFRELGLSVNLSARNLQDENFPDIVHHYLKESGIAPQRLTLEITESSLMEDIERAGRILQKLHDQGVKISIDDFGTGYSSMAHLKQLPINEIKIDKSFVGNMLEDENDAIIVRTTIDLAHNMGRVVTAEGVHSQEIFDLLEILRCDMVQGFHIHKPMPIEDFLSLMMHSA